MASITAPSLPHVLTPSTPSGGPALPGLDRAPRARTGAAMDTTNRPTTLTATQRHQLRSAIDQAVRQRLTPPSKACPECGTDLTASRSRATYGCQTCADRLYRRRTRS